MHSMKPCMALRAWALVALATALLMGAATGAYAAPAEPTMGTSELQALIDADPGGSVSGYFKTVLKGSAIETIPVEIHAVTGGFSDGPPELAALILFDSSAPEIQQIGGIAAGMSGSPLYVDEGAVNDVLVGAVSYGDWFTLNGTGLATPIDAMAAIEDDNPVASLGFKSLSAPVALGERLITNVVIAPGPAGFEDEAHNGTLVVRPLATRYVGGLSPNSPVYKAYRKRLDARGESLVPMAHGLSSMEHPYDAAFAGGSALAVLAARGDLWAGGVGTATYVNGDTVLAFGHPAYYEGDTGLFMTNAWIDGVWPSAGTPYKLARPAGTRGTIVQDRGAGIMGVDGLVSEAATVTAWVRNTDRSKVGTSTVTIPRHAMDSASWDFNGLAPMSTYIAAARACDIYWMPGSAFTTTTVVVSDGTVDYTLVRPNVFDDYWDIQSEAMSDVAHIVNDLQWLNRQAPATAKIKSVDLQATITKQRRYANIVDVNVPGGLRTGTNTAVVSIRKAGVENTQTVNVPFTIPPGVPLTGQLAAYGINGYSYDSGYWDEDEEGYSADSFFDLKPSTNALRTVADTVKDFQDMPSNDTLTVGFWPYDVGSYISGPDVEPKTHDLIRTTTRIGWTIRGNAAKRAPRFRFGTDQDTLPYGWPGMILGDLTNASIDSTAAVSLKYAGSSSSKPIGIQTIRARRPFLKVTPELGRNARVTFAFKGDKRTLPTSGGISFWVKAATRLSPSRTRFPKGKSTTLVANVGPLSASGSIVFERHVGGRWRAIGTRTLVAGKASMRYKPRSTGTYKVRARYVPSSTSTNVKNVSATRKLTVY